MRWSKLKTKVESLFATSVQGRVELHSTRYRSSHDEEGRGYITFDKTEIWNMCTISYYPLEDERTDSIVKQAGIIPVEAQKTAHKELAKEGIFSQYTYYQALEEYCNNSIEKSCLSDNLLIRCLAILDSRFGKRRLKLFDQLHAVEKEKLFYKIRCECEKLTISNEI